MERFCGEFGVAQPSNVRLSRESFFVVDMSLSSREEKKLRVFENMALRRIFVPRRDEVTGGVEIA